MHRVGTGAQQPELSPDGLRVSGDRDGAALAYVVAILVEDLDPAQAEVERLGELLALAGLALWAGSVVTRRVAPVTGVPSDRLRTLRALGPRLAVLGAALSVVASAFVASGSLSALPDVLFATPSGRFRLVLLAAAAFGSRRSDVPPLSPPWA